MRFWIIGYDGRGVIVTVVKVKRAGFNINGATLHRPVSGFLCGSVTGTEGATEGDVVRKFSDTEECLLRLAAIEHAGYEKGESCSAQQNFSPTPQNDCGNYRISSPFFPIQN